MGTEITLDVAGVIVTYSKNHRGIDHGSLFQERDRKAIRSDQLNYDWYKEEGEDPTPSEMAFTRPLKHVVPRLELLGFNLERVRREYDAVAQDWLEERQSLRDDDDEPVPDLMSFTEFCTFVTAHALDGLDDTFISGTDNVSEEKIRGRFSGMQFERIPRCRPYDVHAYSERSFFGGLVDILHPYSVLRLFADSKANEDAPVVWQYGPLLQNGWATEREFVPQARRTETFLIATEGSSDVHILTHALALLRPGIADFFRFIDVSESHPFSGTGNLVKFAEGLAKIDVQNQVVFVFDNDAEGLDAHQRLSTLTLPANMRGIMLPELEEFRSFPAEGPEGLHNSNINCRAAAIECYLDLNVGGHPPAKVLWTNYKKSLGTYQGALEYKESYSKEFLKQLAETLALGTYDVRKIESVLDLLIAECTAIALDQWDPANIELRDGS
ncbi:HEPN/Toprim-associated domain-containing protein [Bradyrhizobium sp. SRS-191]|uniref:HEPN/Toprim-associated domain-containing protein n=1 Tax=Bradyrhizobium sp. SRS-191 TaxID=2962606 RepID=UPI00211E8878|nr:HEPN/Toprim-associated domain-containing protein [Bradyrhizobium sp. SRS-191]